MAEPIKMPFGLRARVGPVNHVLDGGPDPPMGRGNFGGKGAAHCKVQGCSAVNPAKQLNRLRSCVDFDGPDEACIRWSPDPSWEGAIFRGKNVSGYAQ